MFYLVFLHDVSSSFPVVSSVVLQQSTQAIYICTVIGAVVQVNEIHDHRNHTTSPSRTIATFSAPLDVNRDHIDASATS